VASAPPVLSDGFRPLTEQDVPGYVSEHPEILAVVGTVRDVRLLTEGKLNAVFLVTGSRGSAVLKQGLPWVRIYPDWPLSPARTRHEARVYGLVGPLAGELAPRLIGYDEDTNTLALEAIQHAGPWSEDLRTGQADPSVAAALGQFSARLTFWTSAWGADSARRQTLAAGTHGAVLSDMMAHLVFERPFEAHTPHSSGQGTEAGSLCDDVALRHAFSELEEHYRAMDEALIHGDLHVASVLISPASPVVLDFEFARMGPAGFDPGVLWGNLILAVPLAAASGGAAAARAAAALIGSHWAAYTRTFSDLAARTTGAPGAVRSWLRAVETDAVGYAGCEMFRRLTSGDLVLPLSGLGTPERTRVTARLISAACDAVQRRADLTAAGLAAAGLAAVGLPAGDL
jgi:5-methylthioribose kinase